MQQHEQDAMRAVIQASAAGGDLDEHPEGHAFLVVNPKYHDGQRASYIMLPDDFYREVLLREIRVGAEQVRRDSGGRMLAVTKQNVVLTVTTTQLMVHALLSPESWQGGGGEGETTIGQLFQQAQEGGWAVSPGAHQDLFDKLAREHRLTPHWMYSIATNRLTRSRGGAS
jgi:hypothetical protein